MAYSVSDASSTRPTLPSIHTLCLPDLSPSRHELQNSHETYDSHELPTTTNTNANWAHLRQTSVSSISSGTASPSRPVSPSDGIPTPCPPTSDFRLVRTTFDKANAVIVVPPPATFDPSPRSPSPSTSPVDRPRGQAYLLIGPAMEQLRHPQRRLAKGARVHPYRIVRGRSTARRTSASSTSSDVSMDA